MALSPNLSKSPSLVFAQEGERPLTGRCDSLVKCCGRLQSPDASPRTVLPGSSAATSEELALEAGVLELAGEPPAGVKHPCFHGVRRDVDDLRHLVDRFLVVIDEIDDFAMVK